MEYTQTPQNLSDIVSSFLQSILGHTEYAYMYMDMRVDPRASKTYKMSRFKEKKMASFKIGELQ